MHPDLPRTLLVPALLAALTGSSCIEIERSSRADDPGTLGTDPGASDGGPSGAHDPDGREEAPSDAVGFGLDADDETPPCPAAAPDECLDGDTLVRCVGGAWTPTRCGPGATCMTDACVTHQCEDAALDCAGDRVIACQDGFWTAGDLCVATDRRCVDGACLSTPDACEPGARTCLGIQQPARCGDAGWEALTPCSAAQVCEGGACIECPADSGRCVAGNLYECTATSVIGPTSCGDTGLCLGGECVPREGDATCADVFWCASACGDDATCSERCSLEGTRAAQDTYVAMTHCFDAEGCLGADLATSDGLDAAEECVADRCAPLAAACLYGGEAGPGDCATIGACADTCEGSGCAAACADEAVVAAQIRFLFLQICLRDCVDADDPEARDACLADRLAPGGRCASRAAACRAP